MCGKDECYQPNGGPYGRFRKFYVGATYCAHLREFYGHNIATWDDRYKDEDDE